MKMTFAQKLATTGGLILIGLSINAAFKGYQESQVVNPDEAMIVVPQLQYLGESRVSSVNFCVQQVGVKSVDQVITDLQLDILEGCLIDIT